MKKITRIVIAGITLLILIWVSLFFIDPLFFRKDYIESLTRFEIPKSAEIVEYRFGVSQFGAEPFFAKLELNQEDYDVVMENFSFNKERLHEFSRMGRRFNYTSTSVYDIEEIGRNLRLTGRFSMFFSSTSREVEIILITTNDGRHFLYVFYG